MIKRIKQYDWKKYNFSLLCVVIAVCFIGTLCVKLAGGEELGTTLMKGQLTGLGIGLFIVAILSIIDYHFICNFVPIYYIIGLFLTAATHTALGTDNNTDVNRWIKIGPLPSFQPVELMKIILILTIAVLYTKFKNKVDKISTLFIIVVTTMVPVVVILTQPDLSSSLVIVFIMIVLVFAAGTAYKILTPIIVTGIPASLVLFWYVQQPGNFILRGYQYKRIHAWLNPDNDPDQLNWQQNMCINAVASGKLYGKFIQDSGADRASRLYNPIPVNESDFIWSVIGEEFGFLGCCLILLLFAVIIFKCFTVAKKAQDFLGRMIALGVAAMFMFQVFANICVATRIFPNTGLPLPFISNGLSSMISSMIGIGFVMNIGIQPARTSNFGFTMRHSFGSDSAKDIDLDLDL